MNRVSPTVENLKKNLRSSWHFSIGGSSSARPPLGAIDSTNLVSPTVIHVGDSADIDSETTRLSDNLSSQNLSSLCCNLDLMTIDAKKQRFYKNPNFIKS